MISGDMLNDKFKDNVEALIKILLVAAPVAFAHALLGTPVEALLQAPLEGRPK